MYCENPPSCFTESRPRARKQHKCCECRGVIEIGETYQKYSGVWDGEAATYKTCIDCEKLRNDLSALCRENDEEESAFGCLYSDIHDEMKPRYVAIMVRRGAKIHPSWDKYRAARDVKGAE